jgi:hypothetical protein
MFQTHSPESSLTMVERPRCPKCRIRMMLAGIEPSFAGPDLWTFVSWSRLSEQKIRVDKWSLCWG